MDAYNQGRQAFLAGESIDSNPYPHPSHKWSYWWDGWQDEEFWTRTHG